jgi:Xaa-Pro aminopeptidase
VNPRIKKLIASFPASGIDALLVAKDINILYLTGFPASESWLLVSPRGVFYITDSRYVLEVKKRLKGVSVKTYTTSFSIYETLFEAAKKAGVNRLGFDSRHMSFFQYEAMRRKCPKSMRMIKANDLVEGLREVKDACEVHAVRKALGVHKEAHLFLKKMIKPGLCERDVLWELERFVMSKKAAFSFPPIIASGSNSCYPHAKVTERRIRRDDIVLADMGIALNGYKSDLTRMFFFGRIPPLMSEVNGLVRAAQHNAVEKISSGARIADIDGAARNFLEKHKLAKYFGHALGHGVGLEVHEAPRLSQENSAVFKEGMIITVEPAVYIPGKFGVRIEDMVLVQKNGCEVLSDDID